MEPARTLLHALNDQALQLTGKPALWTHRQGAFLPATWGELGDRVKQLAVGLADLELPPGARLLAWCGPREEWMTVQYATWALGGVFVGATGASSAAEVAALAARTDVELAVVETPEAARALKGAGRPLPKLRHLVVLDRGGGAATSGPLYSELIARGSSEGDRIYWSRLEALDPESPAVLAFNPDAPDIAIELTHRNLVAAAHAYRVTVGLHGEDVLVAHRPLSDITDQVMSIHAAVLSGAQSYFVSGRDRLAHDLLEVRPTIFVGDEGAWSELQARAEKRLPELAAREGVAAWARRVAAAHHDALLRAERPGLRDAGEYPLAQTVVFDRLRGALGLSRTRAMFSLGPPLGRERLAALTALDWGVREGYGRAETSGLLALNVDGATKVGTWGRPLLSLEVRIADDGELLLRGPVVCRAKRDAPNAHREGWFHLGAIGELDVEGYLKIYRFSSAT
jgi:long-chain acyl-CoA synthetase